MVKILEGVYGIDHSADKNHSLESWILVCEKTIIVDGGMTGEHVKGIGMELESIGKGWKDVDLILVTHKHPDHINNLPELVELTGAPVMAQKLEAPLGEAAQGVKVEGLEDGRVLPSAISMAGARSDQKLAAIMTPAAKPSMLSSIFRFTFLVIKTTAAPRAVKNHVNNVPDSACSTG